MIVPPVTRVVLYKHGIGYFEREIEVEGDQVLSLSFKQAEVSDVLKSLIVLDLDGGHVSSVSYDSTKPLEQLLSEVALTIDDDTGLEGLLPRLKGAAVGVRSGADKETLGMIVGLHRVRRRTADGVIDASMLALLTDDGRIESFDLLDLGGLRLIDDAVRRDLEYYLRIQIASKKKDAKGFSLFAKGEGKRRVRLGYTVESPVWKATYRILLQDEGEKPLIQGWAAVDNTQDEDWENVSLALVSGLPVSFIHDLYTPRYLKRPEVTVRESTGVAPPEVEESVLYSMPPDPSLEAMAYERANMPVNSIKGAVAASAPKRGAPSSMPAQTRERKIGDLFEYAIEHPVTIRRNQAALVPIVLRPFSGRSVLLYNKATREDNPMRCVEFENTTGLTLEGGPITVLERGDYVGEAMLETAKPDEKRLIPYCVELSVTVTENRRERDEEIHRVVIQRGVLTGHARAIRRTIYSFQNQSDQEYALILEHPRDADSRGSDVIPYWELELIPDWELFDTPAPDEETKNYWRFRLKLAPKETLRFETSQRRTIEQMTSLLMCSADEIRAWIDHRGVDAKTRSALAAAIRSREELARLQSTKKRLIEERAAIHQEQARLRENLKSLSERSAEKSLRDRYVQTLDSQETRLAEIARELAELETRYQTLQDDLARRLSALDMNAGD